jgi:acyl-CoA reductase-like NAD-dependent aldehyde dehydrogenase
MAGPLAPFGGFNMSGNGKEGGRAGLDEFLRVKNVNINPLRPLTVEHQTDSA